MRQHLIILTVLLVSVGWANAANARSDHRSNYYSNQYQSKKHYKQAKKHYRQSKRHSYRDNYSNRRPHSDNYGFRVNNNYGYYNNQRFNQRSHHGQTYYANSSGYYFPNYGYIDNNHRHNRRCPKWHSKSFISGVIFASILGH